MGLQGMLASTTEPQRGEWCDVFFTLQYPFAKHQFNQTKKSTVIYFKDRCFLFARLLFL